MKGELRMMDASGDTKLMWDSEVDDEVKVARDTFNTLKKKKYIAFSVKKDGDKGKAIDEFDPEAEKIIMAPPMAGG